MASFLPPISIKKIEAPKLPPISMTPRATALVTGASFLNTEQHKTNTKGSGFYRGRNNRSLSIAEMSPGDVVRLGSKSSNQ